MKADTIVLYITLWQPSEPQVFRIPEKVMVEYEGNLEDIFYSENYRELAEEITETSFVDAREYGQSGSFTLTQTIDKVFITD